MHSFRVFRSGHDVGPSPFENSSKPPELLVQNSLSMYIRALKDKLVYWVKWIQISVNHSNAFPEREMSMTLLQVHVTDIESPLVELALACECLAINLNVVSL